MARQHRITPKEFEAAIDDLDFDIFEKLPDEGSKLGYHPMFKTARQLLLELNKPLPKEAHLKIGELSGRIRSLHQFGYLVSVPSRLGSRTATTGWQRTPEAVALLKARRQGGR